MGVGDEWDRIFSRLERAPGGEDAWLEYWQDLLEANRDAPVLDLGCGAGEDVHRLVRWGFEVVAADLSEKALELTRRRAPEAATKRVDFNRGLPFPGAHFGSVVASLSLHYFPWPKTVEVLEEVRRCLVPGGYLLARLNSTNDPYHAAARKEEVEPNFYLVNGSPKRLFDRDDVIALFFPNWRVEAAGEKTTGRYGGEKTLWEVVARKTEDRPPKARPESGRRTARWEPPKEACRQAQHEGRGALGDQLRAYYEAVLEGGDRDAGLKRDDGLAFHRVRHPGVVGLDRHPVVDLEAILASVGGPARDHAPTSIR